MTETNSEPIIDLTELVSAGEQIPDDAVPRSENTAQGQDSSAEPLEKAASSSDKARPSPLVSGLLPGLVEKIAGSGE